MIPLPQDCWAAGLSRLLKNHSAPTKLVGWITQCLSISSLARHNTCNVDGAYKPVGERLPQQAASRARAVEPREMKGPREGGRRYGLGCSSRTAGAAGLSPASNDAVSSACRQESCVVRCDEVRFGARVANSRALGARPCFADGQDGMTAVLRSDDGMTPALVPTAPQWVPRPDAPGLEFPGIALAVFLWGTLEP